MLGLLLAPPGRTAAAPLLLTNIAAIKALHPAEAENGWPVRFRGFLTGGRDYAGDTYVQDEKAAVYLMPHPAFKELPLGQEVEIQGVTASRVSGPFVKVSTVTVLDRVALPEPRPATAQDLMDERWDGLRVVVDGEVNLALRNTRAPNEGNFVIGLLLQDGSLPVYISGRPDLEWLLKSRGTRLRVTGICRPLISPRGMTTSGGMLSGPGDTVERVEGKPPPLARPKSSRQSIRQLSHYHGDPSAAKYASIEGVVTAVLSQRTFFLQDETGGVLVRTLRPELVEPGEQLAAEGLPQRDFIPSAARAEESYAMVFHAQDLRRLGRGRLPEPRKLSATHLVEGPLNYRRVALEATLLGTAREADSGFLRMNLQVGNRLLEGMGRSLPAQAAVPAPGSRVRVVGVLDQRPRPDSDQESLRIHLAYIGDLAVLKPPPPDYAPVLGWIAVAVSLLVVLTLSWALTLRRSVRQRTAELVQANAVKSQFLANMSHEIRTPLHAMLGLVQVLGRQPLSADQGKLVGHVTQAGKSLLRILNDILDLSRVEAGQLALERRAFALPELLAHLDALFRESAQDRGLTWQVLPPAGQPLEGNLLGDPLRVQQVLSNLAANALKFTERGRVEVSTQVQQLTETTAQLRFAVADTGPGLAPDALAKLFQPFVQGDASIHRRYGGTGLGLSICRRLVDLMGGRMGADSQPGRGSTFWAELTFERTREPSTLAQPQPAASPAHHTPLAGRRILVVDDNRLNLELADWVLRQQGATPVLLESAAEALALLSSGQGDPIDAILMDLEMPEIDGLTAIRRLRQGPPPVTLPIIACTAGPSDERRAAALAAGAGDFLAKPVDIEVLVHTLVRCLPTAPGQAGALDEPTLAPSPRPVEPFPVIPGLDTRHAATVLRHDRALFQKLLRDFVRQFGDLPQLLTADLASGREAEAGRRLHQLRGITGYLGALDLAEDARQLQLAVLQGAPDVPRRLETFTHRLDTLLASLQSPAHAPHLAPDTVAATVAP